MALPYEIEDHCEELRSGIMPVVCELIRREPGCNLVDLGAASMGNCMTFSRNGARVFLDTSLKSLRAKLARGGLGPDDIDGLLRHCPDAIDVLLFWDILDYVSLETVEAFMQRFGGVLRPGALIYVMISQRRYVPPEPAVIDLMDEGERLRFQHGAPELEGPRYAPKQLEQRMPGCSIEKLYLMQNGVQEHLFVYQGPEQS